MRFRDIAIIWLVVAQTLFYVTPILYPVTAFDDATNEHLLMVNPLAVIFEQVRVWVLAEPQAPTAVEAAGGWLGPAPGDGDLRRPLRLRGLDLQPRGAPHRRGPLTPPSPRRTAGRLGRMSLEAELAREKQEVVRLRNLLIARDAELGEAKGRVAELESRSKRLLGRLRGIVGGARGSTG